MERDVADVVRVFVEDGAGHGRAVCDVGDDRADGDERVLVVVAHEHANIHIALRRLERHAPVGAARRVEIEEDAQIGVSEIDVKSAAGVDGRRHASEGIDELIAVGDVQGLKHGPDVRLAGLAVDAAADALVGDVQLTVARHLHLRVAVGELHADVREAENPAG